MLNLYKDPNGACTIDIIRAKKTKYQFFEESTSKAPRKTSLNYPSARDGKTFGDYTCVNGIWRRGRYIPRTFYKYKIGARYTYKFLSKLGLPTKNRWYGTIITASHTEKNYNHWIELFKKEMDAAVIIMNQNKDKIITATAKELEEKLDEFDHGDYNEDENDSNLVVDD